MDAVLAHVGDPSRSPWDFHLHPDVSAAMTLVVLAYVFALPRLGRRLVPAGEPVVTPPQRWCLVAAIGLMWVSSEWPVHDLSEGHSYLVHMLQHSVYTLAVPPLVIAGTPPWLWRAVLTPILGIARRVVHPVAAVTVFSAVTVGSHLPVVANATLTSGALHAAVHATLLVAAGIVWWPLLSPLPELPRLTRPVHQMVYVFASRLAPAIAGSSLIWARGTPYRAYERFPELWGIGDLQDQRWAGTVMELAEGVVLWGLLLTILYRTTRSSSPVDVHS